MASYTIGLDYGTNSVRAVVVAVARSVVMAWSIAAVDRR